jgi:hypothetical protein
MASTSTIATRKFVEFLSSPSTGVSPVIAQLAEDSGVRLAPVLAGQIIGQNVSAELNSRSHAGAHFPTVHVYVDRVRNLLTEKFRRFSGKIRTVAEIRVSLDRVEGIEEQLRLYVDAVTQVLDTNRGSWGEGAFYTGGYEVVFEPVKSGGRGFLQVARVVFEVDLSS